MTSLSTDEIKRIEFEMLKILDTFANEKKLEYCLASGTLLGAIRHQGFIPWDDDIDIFMPRDSYEYFIKKFNDIKGIKYKVITKENTPEYPYAYAKLIDTTTLIDEYRFLPYKGGVFLDILPLDDLGNNMKNIVQLNKKLSKYRKLLEFKMDRFSYYHGKKKAGLFLAKLVTLFYKREQLIDKINLLSQSLKTDNSKYCACMVVLGQGIREVFKKSWFQEYILVDFEGSFFKAPAGYKNVLEAMYGNYMKLPPKEKRITTHSFDAWNIVV